MGQTPIPTGRKAIHLHPRLFAETAIRYLHEKAGGAARVLTVRYGSAVNATRSKESWMCQTPRGGRNADKGISDGLECVGGESRGFHGAVDGTTSERKFLGKLSGREVHRIHRWGRVFD